MAHLLSFPRLSTLFAAAAVLAAAATTAEDAQPAPGPTLRELAVVGAQAPGCAAGTTIQAIGDAPRIDQAGNVSWVVSLRDPDGGFAQALYRWTGGAPELVFRSGDPSPGGGHPFQLFPGVPQTPRISGGRLNFAGSIDNPDAAGRDGLWSDRFGGFERLLLTGEHLPGTPAGATLAGFGYLVRGDTVLLRGSYAEGSSIPAGNRGIWRNRTGPWETILVRGMAAPGISGAVFDSDPTGVYGPVFGIAADGDGAVVAQGFVRGGRGIDANNDEGLWIERGGGLQLLVREGAKAGGSKVKITFGPHGTAAVFGGDGENMPVAVSDTGAVLFGAMLRGGKSRWTSVWTNRSGGLELLARGGLPISGYGEGDPAPGLAPGATFGLFTQGAINRDGTIAVEGFGDETGSFFSLTEALWWDDPGTLALVAAAGRPAAGLGGANYADLTLEGLTDAGVLYFSATLSGPGVTGANDRAVFRVAPGGGVAVVLREGDAVQVVDAAGRTAQRTVAGFVFGPGVETAGRAALHAVFSDGGSGVYRIDPL